MERGIKLIEIAKGQLLDRRGVLKSFGSLIMAILWFAGIAAYGIGAADLGALGGVIGWRFSWP